MKPDVIDSNSNSKIILSIDECGKGALFGPLCLCANIYTVPNSYENLLDEWQQYQKDIKNDCDTLIGKELKTLDSKRVTNLRREKIFNQLFGNSFKYNFFTYFVFNDIIDRLGIDKAWSLGVYNLVTLIKDCFAPHSSLENPILQIYLDGSPQFISGLESYNVDFITKGDHTLFSIGLASIIGKTLRDKYIENIIYSYKSYKSINLSSQSKEDKLFRNDVYDLLNNKGYGTQKHREGLLNYGLSKLHRKSFTKAYQN